MTVWNVTCYVTLRAQKKKEQQREKKEEKTTPIKRKKKKSKENNLRIYKDVTYHYFSLNMQIVSVMHRVVCI